MDEDGVLLFSYNPSMPMFGGLKLNIKLCFTYCI